MQKQEGSAKAEKKNGHPVKNDRISNAIVSLCVLLLVNLADTNNIEIDAAGYYHNVGGSVHIKMD